MTTGLKVSLLMDEGTRSDLLKMIKEQVRPLVKENIDALTKALVADASKKIVEGGALREAAMQEFKRQLREGFFGAESPLMRDLKKVIEEVVDIKFSIIVKNYTDNYLNDTVGRMVRAEVKRMLSGQ